MAVVDTKLRSADFEEAEIAGGPGSGVGRSRVSTSASHPLKAQRFVASGSLNS